MLNHGHHHYQTNVELTKPFTNKYINSSIITKKIRLTNFLCIYYALDLCSVTIAVQRMNDIV